MNLLKRLWRDEAGVILSAETVMLGTVGVIGVVAGLGAVRNSVTGELEETAYAIRSLNQSYGIHGFRGCGAWTAGSFYCQPPVQHSIDRLQIQMQADLQGLREQVEAERQSEIKPSTPDDVKQPKAAVKKKANPKKKKNGKPTVDESDSPTPIENELPE